MKKILLFYGAIVTIVTVGFMHFCNFHPEIYVSQEWRYIIVGISLTSTLSLTTSLSMIFRDFK